MIERFAPNRADEALNVAVLRRRVRRDRGSHGANAMGVGFTESLVPVAEQMRRRFIPRECFGDLAGDPLGSWIGRHGNRDEPPAGVTQDHQAVEQLERDRADNERIHRSDVANVTAQESLPTSGRWSAVPDHIPAHRGLRDVIVAKGRPGGINKGLQRLSHVGAYRQEPRQDARGVRSFQSFDNRVCRRLESREIASRRAHC
jgi:hypothetical protein